MNERIRQLLNEATVGLEPDLSPQRTVTLNEMEKFAELIVLESVNTVMDGTKEGDHYAMRIEQHFDNGPGGILYFGVEE